jgi:hypothetical protein
MAVGSSKTSALNITSHSVITEASILQITKLFVVTRTAARMGSSHNKTIHTVLSNSCHISEKIPNWNKATLQGWREEVFHAFFPLMRTTMAITDPTKFDLIRTRNFLTHKHTRVISSFRRRVNEICALLGCYAA